MKFNWGFFSVCFSFYTSEGLYSFLLNYILNVFLDQENEKNLYVNLDLMSYHREKQPAEINQLFQHLAQLFLLLLEIFVFRICVIAVRLVSILSLHIYTHAKSLYLLYYNCLG